MNKIINIILSLTVALILIPRLWLNFGFEKRELPSRNFLEITHQTERYFPPENGNAVAIFWATWCGPCKIEMDRLASSVRAGKIPAERIFAINVSEDIGTQKEFLTKSPYPFTFIDAPALVQELEINSTPTVIFVKDQVITSLSSGMSLIGIWRSEWLF